MMNAQRTDDDSPLATRQSPLGLRGTLLLDEPMARHTSWRVGGPAQRFYAPADLADLSDFLRSLPADEALLWLGLGSNLLVRDGGFAGTVIALHAALNSLELISALTVRAEAGVPCAKVARFCARNDLVGAEFLVGIPGTMGGALAMNAGAFGGVTWEHVSAVETIDRAGNIRTRDPADFQVGYRHVQKPDGEWFVAAHLSLKPGDGNAAQTRGKELLEQRNRNPTDQSAELRFGVPQSARRSCRAFDRSRGTEGLQHRRRQRVREARQFHRQHRRRQRCGY